MAKLLIVESPTKARTISRMLGQGYDIIASMGHIRDLPEKELGVDIANNFAPQYVDTPRSRPVVRTLKTAVKKADEIYLAPDPDREGEAIAWHLKSVLESGTKAPFYRVTFHEITRNAIEQAMQNKGDIDQRLVDAQQARRVLDRIVGYQVSPLLWRKLEKGSSAGRVQSAALRLIVEREREILSFIPEEYWNFSVIFGTQTGEQFRSRLFKINAKDFKVPDTESAQKVKAAIENGSKPCIADVNRQRRRRFPQPPFTTSTLQQAANSRLRFTATQTMRYAQQLYEGVDLGGSGPVGLITYMRTDSVTIAKEAQIAAGNFIRRTYGEQYAPEKFNFYKNKAAAQEAHEAIRPTDVTRTPEVVAPFLDPAQLKLYTMIWKRFVASQMTPAQFDQTSVDTVVHGSDNSDYTFHSTASVMVFPGFTQLYDDTVKSKDEEDTLPENLAVNDLLDIKKFNSEQKFTEPPARYTEAALIKELENNGIGRPSTYATILRTIQDREYVKREQNKLSPTELGFSVNDFLVGKLPELFNIGFTAQMETLLDKVEEGEISWVGMMADFYEKFAPWLKAAKDSDAPPADEAQTIISLLKNLTFEQPKKVGRRTYDDAKFYNSVVEKFASAGKISAKQYQTMLQLAAKYLEQLSSDALAQLPAKIREEITELKDEQKKREQALAESSAQAAQIDYAGLFNAFSNVTFDPPVVKGRFTYDDKKFFESLKKQALDGRVLSEKQNASLSKMAQKYQAQLSNPELVSSILGTVFQSAPAENSDQIQQEISVLLESLSKVSSWEPPVKRGRYTADDKKFYESLKKQFSEKKTLSDKQLAALKKLADKYKEQ
ncbi:MAG: type I DNA topoisomerase [Lentisphaerae bacterium]|nr:type I DNA topoisomerase [Lentisphaerota bacterium]